MNDARDLVIELGPCSRALVLSRVIIHTASIVQLRILLPPKPISLCNSLRDKVVIK